MRKKAALSLALALGMTMAGSAYAESTADRTQDGGMGNYGTAGSDGTVGSSYANGTSGMSGLVGTFDRSDNVNRELGPDWAPGSASVTTSDGVKTTKTFGSTAGYARDGQSTVFDWNGNGNGFLGLGNNGNGDGFLGLGNNGNGDGTWFGRGLTGGGFLGTRGNTAGTLGSTMNGDYNGGVSDTANADRNGLLGTRNGWFGANANDNGGTSGTTLSAYDYTNTGNGYTALATDNDGIDWGWLGLLGLLGLAGIRSRRGEDSPRI